MGRTTVAWYLCRLGRWCFRRKWLVAGLWSLVLAVTVLGSLTLSGKTSEQFELSGVESTQAFELIKERSPAATPDGASALIVFEAPTGTSLTGGPEQRVMRDALRAVDSPSVESVTPPSAGDSISADGSVAFATVAYTKSAVDLTEDDRAALQDAQQIGERGDLKVVIGGEAAEPEEGPPIGELLGIVIAFFVLLITFGSLVAAGMPLLTAIIGLGIGITAISTLSGFVDLSSTTTALGTMLGLAVGIDYALFIMSRYQHEVRRGRTLEEAAGRAVGTAGSAVIFAGLTVVIALAGLAVCGIGFLTQMGLAGAGMVIIAVLIALTLLPALLGFAGRRVTSGRLRFLKDRDPEGGGGRTNGRRWVEMVTRFKVPVLIAGVGLAAVVSIPVASMQLALPDAATDPAGSGTRVAFDLVADNFGAGANGPLLVVVDTAEAAEPMAAVDAVVTDLEGIGSGVTSVVPPASAGDAEGREGLEAQLQAVQFATVTVVPESGPSDQATKALVDTIRERLADLPAQTGARALVTGQTAVGVDLAQELTDVFPLYLAVVVGLAFLLLIVVFRSLLVPLKAALGFLLSVGVSLGATVAVFQWGWMNQLLGLDTTSPVIFILPLLLTGVLFGLAMDYEVFLVTRMREAYIHGTPARRAVIDGFEHSARVVVAAALIMIGVFAGFALVDDVILKTIGFGLAVGVLADAFLVRMTIVPAVMAIAGDRIWWMPQWLDRVVPNLDVEGEALVKRLDDPASAAP